MPKKFDPIKLQEQEFDTERERWEPGEMNGVWKCMFCAAAFGAVVALIVIGLIAVVWAISS